MEETMVLSHLEQIQAQLSEIRTQMRDSETGFRTQMRDMEMRLAQARLEDARQLASLVTQQATQELKQRSMELDLRQQRAADKKRLTMIATAVSGLVTTVLSALVPVLLQRLAR
jgi:hypothetical protein